MTRSGLVHVLRAESLASAALPHGGDVPVRLLTRRTLARAADAILAARTAAPTHITHRPATRRPPV